jgi:hypothetical protein
LCSIFLYSSSVTHEKSNHFGKCFLTQRFPFSFVHLSQLWYAVAKKILTRLCISTNSQSPNSTQLSAVAVLILPTLNTSIIAAYTADAFQLSTFLIQRYLDFLSNAVKHLHTRHFDTIVSISTSPNLLLCSTIFGLSLICFLFVQVALASFTARDLYHFLYLRCFLHHGSHVLI